jgi:hypothetical protein
MTGVWIADHRIGVPHQANLHARASKKNDRVRGGWTQRLQDQLDVGLFPCVFADEITGAPCSRLFGTSVGRQRHCERCDAGKAWHHSRSGHSAIDVVSRGVASGKLAPGTRPNRLSPGLQYHFVFETLIQSSHGRWLTLVYVADFRWLYRLAKTGLTASACGVAGGPHTYGHQVTSAQGQYCKPPRTSF